MTTTLLCICACLRSKHSFISYLFNYGVNNCQSTTIEPGEARMERKTSAPRHIKRFRIFLQKHFYVLLIIRVVVAAVVAVMMVAYVSSMFTIKTYNIAHSYEYIYNLHMCTARRSTANLIISEN